MRVHVVSDVHGAADSLAAAGQGCEVFICLGDLLLYLDYADPSVGAFAEVFGPEMAHEYVALRLAKRFDAARDLTARAWQEQSGGADPAARFSRFTEIMERQYTEIFAAMPPNALLTYGNIDMPKLWPRYLRPDLQVLDGQAIDVEGVRFGFVGGGLFSPYRTLNEMAPEAYAAKLALLGPVDVLCTHIPPSVPELTFDIVARRFEVGSAAIVDYIVANQPSFALFGHVHQPMAKRFRIGRTECLNVGHFRATRVPFVLDLPPLLADV